MNPEEKAELLTLLKSIHDGLTNAITVLDRHIAAKEEEARVLELLTSPMGRAL